MRKRIAQQSSRPEGVGYTLFGSLSLSIYNDIIDNVVIVVVG